MCSTPKMPTDNTAVQQPLATPTAADAKVSKASTNTKNKASSLANRNIRTSARGLSDETQTTKKGLLGE